MQQKNKKLVKWKILFCFRIWRTGLKIYFFFRKKLTYHLAKNTKLFKFLELNDVFLFFRWGEVLLTSSSLILGNVLQETLAKLQQAKKKLVNMKIFPFQNSAASRTQFTLAGLWFLEKIWNMNYPKNDYRFKFFRVTHFFIFQMELHNVSAVHPG